MPRVDRRAQPQYTQNDGCKLWPSYEEANNWQICELVASMPEDERCARELNKCVLNAMEVHISLMIREGEVGVVVATDEAAMGYYVVKWLSKPYSL